MQSSANRCKLDGTNIGTPPKPPAATSNLANVYAVRKAHWKCGAGKPVAASDFVAGDGRLELRHNLVGRWGIGRVA